MEAIPLSANSHVSLPRLSMPKHSYRRDSLSSSRTRDSGYSSDFDSLSPLEIAASDQDLFPAPLPCVPNIFHGIKAAPFQSCVSFERPRLSGRNIPPSDPARAVAGRRIPRSVPGAPELEIVACNDGAAETLKAEQASQDEEIEKWVNENLPSSNKPDQRSLSIISLSSTSSCDMYTSTDVSDDEYEYEKGLLVPQQTKPTVKVIEFIVRKVEVSLRHAAYKQCVGNDTSNTHTVVSIPTNQSSGKTSPSSGSKRKSRQDSLPPDDEDDEESPNKRRRGSVTVSDESEMGIRFACPFYKHDPNRYRNRRTCPGPGWTTVHRMKEHLYRSHAQPIFCPICYTTFKSDKEQSIHVRLQECERSSPQQIDGIDRETVWTLRKRTTALRLEEDKWRDVYQILFPHVPAADIPSPFYDCDSPSEASRRFRRDLLRRVQEELYAEAEQMPSPVEQQLLQRVAQIVRRCEHELINQARPTLTANFNIDRRPSASSIGSSYQATPASALSPPTTTTVATTQRPCTPVAPDQLYNNQTNATMALQGTMQYIPEPAADFSQMGWDDQPYNPFSLGIDWDDVFSSASNLQYRSSDEHNAAVFSRPMWT